MSAQNHFLEHQLTTSQYVSESKPYKTCQIVLITQTHNYTSDVANISEISESDNQHDVSNQQLTSYLRY